MPTPTFPFQNTDLHNIYDAITGGGGGAGAEDLFKLFDGQTNPSNYSNFYPAKFLEFALYGQNTTLATQTTTNLLDGINYPSDPSGFYPLAVAETRNNTENTANYTKEHRDLFLGTKEPDDLGGFYPMHVEQDSSELIKIDSNTNGINVSLANSLKFGTAFGNIIQKASGTGYSSPDLAAAAAVNFMNARTGSNVVVNLTFNDRGGSNGHSWTLIFVNQF
jgi:hypothetical protein